MSYDPRNPLHRCMKYFDRNLKEDSEKVTAEIAKLINIECIKVSLRLYTDVTKANKQLVNMV